MKRHLFLMLLALNTGVHGVDQSTGKPDTSWVQAIEGSTTKKAVQNAQKDLAVPGYVVPQWDKPSLPVAFKGHITKDASSASDTGLISGRDLYIGWINDLLKKQPITQGEAKVFRVDLDSSERVAEQFGYLFDRSFGGLNRHIKCLRMPVVVHNEDGLLEPKDMVIAALQRYAFIGVPSNLHPEWHPDEVKGEGQTRFTSSGFSLHDFAHSVASMDILNDDVRQAMMNVAKNADTNQEEDRKTIMPLFWLSNEIMPDRHPEFLRVQHAYGMGHALQLSRKELDETGSIDPNKERTGPAGSTYTLNSFSSEMVAIRNHTEELIKINKGGINVRRNVLDPLLSRLTKDGATQDDIYQVDKELRIYEGLKPKNLANQHRESVEELLSLYSTWSCLGLDQENQFKKWLAILKKDDVTYDDIYPVIKEVGIQLGVGSILRVSSIKDRLSNHLSSVEQDMQKVEDEEKDANKVWGGRWWRDMHAILDARTYDQIDALQKTYTADPHAYVDSLFNLLIDADKDDKHREDKQQLDAMIGWVDSKLPQINNKGTPEETYNNWDTFVQLATECKAKVHNEINKIRQTKETAPTDQA